MQVNRMVCQIRKISQNRSLFEFILCMRILSFALIYNHIFSITFKSGDFAGQLIFFRRVLATYSLVERALCTGALSSWNKQPFPGKCQITGQILSPRMLMYLSAFIFPSAFAVVAYPSPHHDTEFAVRSLLHKVRSPPFSTFPPYICTVVPSQYKLVTRHSIYLYSIGTDLSTTFSPYSMPIGFFSIVKLDHNFLFAYSPGKSMIP